jgi:hypothetical protein
MIYHCFSLLLLAYLVWRRPIAGTLIGILEGIWLLWPLYGLPDLLPVDVHLTLALTCLFAWRSDDLLHSLGLAVAGGLVFGMLYHAPSDAWGRPATVLGGVLCGELIVAVWMTGRLLRRNHSVDERSQPTTLIQRASKTLTALNAPLGRNGASSTLGVNLHRADPIPEQN